jgi:DNA invertase Pin-like site-specific DNA recombinase|tara:strand:- start:1342 stop:2028 length:687 start_codon:yes stop_codon:yes gene_type:complete
MKNKRALAYYRTSSAANVGADKDSLERQQEAVRHFARSNGYEVIEAYYDAAVSGADPIQQRKGFVRLLSDLSVYQADTILVENASRFARDLAVQLAGHDQLRDLGVNLIPVDAPTHFQDETPTAEMVRQILGSVSQFEKAQLVAKLRSARQRVRERLGKCEGRKSIAELHPELFKEARRLRRRSPKTGKQRSYRKIAEALQQQGYSTAKGKAYSASMVARLVGYLNSP